MQSSLPYRLGTTPVFEFVRIGTDPLIGRAYFNFQTVSYYRDDFSSHRTVAEMDALQIQSGRTAGAAGQGWKCLPGCNDLNPSFHGDCE